MAQSIKGRGRRGTVRQDLGKAPGPGQHPGNNDGPSIDVIAMFAHRLRRKEEVKDEADQAVKDVWTQMKNAGITKEVFNKVRKDLDLDPDTVLQRNRQYNHYAKALGAAPMLQLNLFADGEAEKPSELKKAYDYGYRIGLDEFGTLDDRYHENSPEGQKALEGYQAAQKIVVAEFMRLQTAEQDRVKAETEAKEKKKAERQRRIDEKEAKKKAKDDAKAKVKPRGRKNGGATAEPQQEPSGQPVTGEGVELVPPETEGTPVPPQPEPAVTIVSEEAVTTEEIPLTQPAPAADDFDAGPIPNGLRRFPTEEPSKTDDEPL